MDSRAQACQCAYFCTLSDLKLISQRIDHRQVKMSELAVVDGIKGLRI